MRPPYIASTVALAHGNMIGAALAIAALALVAMVLLASRRAQATPEDINEPLERLNRSFIFGPQEDDGPPVHVPVLRHRPAPAAAAAARPAATGAASGEAVGDETSQALSRVAAFAVRQAYVPEPPVVAEAAPPPAEPVPPTPAPNALHDTVEALPARSLPGTPQLDHVRPPAPRPDRKRGELPLDGDILLVEDDAAIAELYQMLLRSRGYTTRHAHDGLDGIAKVRDERPALILLDMMMPRMDGIQFLEALRSWPKTSAIPVVILSNADNFHLVDRAMSLGAVEYLVKAQTRPQVLLGALPHWLRGNRALSTVS